MIKIITGMRKSKKKLKYTASKKQPPTHTKKGMYGTPKNMGGRVQPRNNASLCIDILGIDQQVPAVMNMVAIVAAAPISTAPMRTGATSAMRL
jgi:hypothetical protein